MDIFTGYEKKICGILSNRDWSDVARLAESLCRVWFAKEQLFICGNGGSAANAMHMANDFLYGVSDLHMPGMRVEALSANSSVLTCLANDVGYDEIFSEQLRSKANERDILIVLSGSGNSKNIVRALIKAKELRLETFAILGYSGGECLKLADTAIHFPVDDMQIAEDLQLSVGHMCMKYLKSKLSDARR